MTNVPVGRSIVDFERWLARLQAWAKERGDILGVAIVGSHARGAAREDSDVDVVMVVDRTDSYLEDDHWITNFGDIDSMVREDYGLVQSLRVSYKDGSEIEWGVADPRWCSVPADEGTAQVVRDGMRIVLDRDGRLIALLHHVLSSSYSPRH